MPVESHRPRAKFATDRACKGSSGHPSKASFLDLIFDKAATLHLPFRIYQVHPSEPLLVGSIRPLEWSEYGLKPPNLAIRSQTWALLKNDQALDLDGGAVRNLAVAHAMLRPRFPKGLFTIHKNHDGEPHKVVSMPAGRSPVASLHA